MKKLLLSLIFMLSLGTISAQEGFILIMSDKDCSITIDGAHHEQVTANTPKKINIGAGEHFVNAEAMINGSKTTKSHEVAVEAGKQKLLKLEFGAAEKSEAASAPLREYSHINPKEVLKSKLILTKEFQQNGYKLENLGGVSFDLEESDSRRVANDLNMLKAVIPGERKFNSCAVLVIYLKNGSTRVFYGNGKRFNEIVNGRPEGEYYTQTAWNIVSKHFDIKKELLCDDKDF